MYSVLNNKIGFSFIRIFGIFCLINSVVGDWECDYDHDEDEWTGDCEDFEISGGLIAVFVIVGILIFIGIPVLCCFCCACACFSYRKNKGKVLTPPTIITIPPQETTFVPMVNIGQVNAGYPQQEYNVQQPNNMNANYNVSNPPAVLPYPQDNLPYPQGHPSYASTFQMPQPQIAPQPGWK